MVANAAFYTLYLVYYTILNAALYTVLNAAFYTILKASFYTSSYACASSVVLPPNVLFSRSSLLLPGGHYNGSHSCGSSCDPSTTRRPWWVWLITGVCIGTVVLAGFGALGNYLKKQWMTRQHAEPKRLAPGQQQHAVQYGDAQRGYPLPVFKQLTWPSP